MSVADRAATVADAAKAAPGGDSARVETGLPLAPAALLDFLADTERLLRLNPHLKIETWQPVPGGFRLVAENETNGQRLETGVRVAYDGVAATHSLRYDSGLKQGTSFVVEAGAGGARLVVTEYYPRIEDPQDPRLVEVDRSLVPWVAALRRHLIARRRWGWLPGWHWWNERFLPGLPPGSRRIVRMLVWISVLEFAVFLAAIVVLRLAS